MEVIPTGTSSSETQHGVTDTPVLAKVTENYHPVHSMRMKSETATFDDKGIAEDRYESGTL